MCFPEPFRGRHQTLRNEFFWKGVARPLGAVKDLYGRRKDGAQFPVEIGLDPIQTEDGSCVLASIVDVSERKLAEEKLRTLPESLEQAPPLGRSGAPAGVLAAYLVLAGMGNDDVLPIGGIEPEVFQPADNYVLRVVEEDSNEEAYPSNRGRQMNV